MVLIEYLKLSRICSIIKGLRAVSGNMNRQAIRLGTDNNSKAESYRAIALSIPASDFVQPADSLTIHIHILE